MGKNYEEFIAKIHQFWFENLGNDSNLKKNPGPQKIWFSKSDQTDQSIREQFGEVFSQAREGNLKTWKETPQGRLALVILLDQFSRNLLRQSPQAFEKDGETLQICLQSIEDQSDQSLFLVERMFLYMPLMHSEDIAMQKKALVQFQGLADLAQKNCPQNLPFFQFTFDFAKKHFDIIERFQRFPHRNEVLGRQSTPEELEFLKKPGSSF